MRVFVPLHWIVTGEERLAYTTIVRLVECCREYHWERDFGAGAAADSVGRAMDAEFFRAIGAGRELEISYAITSIGDKSYGLEFTVFQHVETADCDKPCARLGLTSVFYDAQTGRSKPMSTEARALLEEAKRRTAVGWPTRLLGRGG